MRVLFVVPRYLPHLGGIENHVHALATAMAGLGHQVVVATQLEGANLPAVDEVDGVQVRRFASRLPLFGQGISPALWTAVRPLAASSDVTHVHNVHAITTLGVLAALRSRPPVVVTPHYLGVGAGTAQRVLHAVYSPALASQLRPATAVICTSRAEADQLQHHLGVPATKIRVIPNGIDRARLDAAVPVAVPGRLILTAGRLEPYKQHDRVLAGLPYTPADTHLAIAGAGPAHDALVAQARLLGVEDRVSFLGALPSAELARWYRAALVVASMSTRESFGLTLVEGMAAGAAVVASDIAPHREVVESTNSGAGLLVPVDADAATVGKALDAALQLRHERPPAVLDWGQVAQATLECYQDIAGR